MSQAISTTPVWLALLEQLEAGNVRAAYQDANGDWHANTDVKQGILSVFAAGVQVGDVLEPVGQAPVIIEDDAFIGAGCVLVEGVIVKRGAVLAPGVQLSAAVPVYDMVNECQLPKGSPVPENAVVVPGSRPASSEWGRRAGLSVQCPIIIKYRDEGSDASLQPDRH